VVEGGKTILKFYRFRKKVVESGFEGIIMFGIISSAPQIA